MKIVIIGGVAGGASAAARARRLDEHAEIVILERGAHPSFANCGLPYYVGGEIASRDKLLVAPAEMLRQRHRLDVRVRSEAMRIDRHAKIVAVRNLETGDEYDESYDKLIIATGAKPLRPDIPGIENDQIYTLRDLADADRLHAVATSGAGRAAIVGGGFIGVEMAENLVQRGLDVTLVERNDQVLPPWDAEIAAPFAERMEAHGVRILLGESAEGFADRAEGVEVKLSSGRTLAVDFVVLAIGVSPESQLVRDADLACGERGGVIVNDRMQTSDADIYAVGDVVQTQCAMTSQPVQIPLAGPANRQGRIAADNIFGRESRYRGTQGTAIVGAFGKTAAMTGHSEKQLRRLGQEFEKIYIHPSDHAGYYPGAEPMTLKLLFDPHDGRILGAQAVGGAGVDKRIDVLAIAMQAKMTVFDLEEAELCYAPQYGHAKDPINMAGFVAAGVIRGDHQVTHTDRLIDDPENPTLVDVRTPKEYEAGSIPGAVSMPIEELRGRYNELPTDGPLITYCQLGQRGYLASRVLQQLGRDAKNLSGGYKSWRQGEDAQREGQAS